MKKTILIFILILSVLPGCTNRKYLYLEGNTQGTSYHIKYADSKERNFASEIGSLLDTFEKSLSIYDSTSIISRINRNEPGVEVDELFSNVFGRAMEVSEQTQGDFDITVGPLVNFWGFGVNPEVKIDSSKVHEMLSYIGYSKVKMVNKKVIKQDPRIQIDVNAIAQGYSCDVVGNFLRSKGIRHFMVEIGGEVLATGKNPDGTDWKIGIDKPVTGNMIPGADLQTVVALKNKALATSGNYRKFREVNGIKYAHTINPHTGFPVMQNLLSASIIASDCMTADAYATACMVMGLEAAKKFLLAHSELEGYLIYSDEQGIFRVWRTKKFPEI